MIYILMALLLVVAIAVYWVSYYAFKGITLRKRSSVEQCFGFVERDGLYLRTDFEKLPRESIELKSKDGLTLRGVFVEKLKENKRVIIIVHGYTAAYSWSTQFINMFLKEGFNVLLVDQRSHGSSDGKYATYGYYEKYDLDLWVSWVRERVGEDAVIGLHGQSMGGGTVLEYAAINKFVKFIIADCPYSDMKRLMKHQFEKLNHIPMFPFFSTVNLIIMMKAKFSMKNVNPLKAMQDKDIPIMFIHGSNDNFVPTYMSEEMYKAKKGAKRLLIIEGAVHGNAYGTNKELYEREVHDFLKDVVA